MDKFRSNYRDLKNDHFMVMTQLEKLVKSGHDV